MRRCRWVAVKSKAPQETWGQNIEKLAGLELHPKPLDVGTDSFNDPDDEPLDLTESIDEDDEL